MKEKIITFLLGLFLGAVISTGSIYFYTLANDNKQDDFKMNNMDQPNNMQNQGFNPGGQNETNIQNN